METDSPKTLFLRTTPFPAPLRRSEFCKQSGLHFFLGDGRTAYNRGSALSGPTATVTIILSRYTVVLHSVALRFPGFGEASQENRATPPEKGPVSKSKTHPSKPHPCNMPQAKTEVALQFLECCAAEVALQRSLSAVRMLF